MHQLLFSNFWKQFFSPVGRYYQLSHLMKGLLTFKVYLLHLLRACHPFLLFWSLKYIISKYQFLNFIVSRKNIFKSLEFSLSLWMGIWELDVSSFYTMSKIITSLVSVVGYFLLRDNCPMLTKPLSWTSD